MAPTGGDDAELMSLASPRSSFSVGRRNSMTDNTTQAQAAEDVVALLAFYRRRCDEFQSERQLTLDRLAQIEVLHASWSFQAHNMQLNRSI